MKPITIQVVLPSATSPLHCWHPFADQEDDQKTEFEDLGLLEASEEEGGSSTPAADTMRKLPFNHIPNATLLKSGRKQSLFTMNPRTWNWTPQLHQKMSSQNMHGTHIDPMHFVCAVFHLIYLPLKGFERGFARLAISGLRLRANLSEGAVL